MRETTLMDVQIFATSAEMARAAAQCGAASIRQAVEERGEAAVVFACAASQMEMLDALLAIPNIPWHRVHVFHLDEYVGLSIEHPASFRQFLWKRVVSRMPLPPKSICYLQGDSDPHAECRRAGEQIAKHAVDVAFVGIGENCHLAFNDPPADFETKSPYLVVELDEECRRQQVGEGWYPSLADVPKQALSMGIQQILTSRRIICTVPDTRKANAVRAAVEGEVTPSAPASILQTHAGTTLFLDEPAASLLTKQPADAD